MTFQSTTITNSTSEATIVSRDAYFHDIKHLTISNESNTTMDTVVALSEKPSFLNIDQQVSKNGNPRKEAK